ncbi:MAG: sigma-70 family RNA polymerase sigma factor [Bacteroidales bacterium]|jgi:RNA polymerase sigma factor (sigma-70 family)|nr:sigma-70 family RNA polymerase sigma factor [Bacteroidales bacterium]MDD2424432.1 sigma-70 family RNA polymerase sigma factor [Bacteroidales bacterium]MDD3990244.1 sigma-70 family RNA polymerase sigma factor [Bacteroidales bacterium]MDD4638281.1 sigma-70 family RNA polymerase sigma factor [Bacteroidales bacterium]
MTESARQGSDPQLWAHFKKGDREAFSRIYELYVDVLFAYGAKISADRDMVKDSVHEVFLQLYKQRNNLSDISNLKFYLFKSLKNILLRRINRERRFSELFGLRMSSPEFHIEYSVEENIILDEQEKRVKEYVLHLLENLNSRQREILYLRFNQGFSYDQISKITGIDGNSAKKQVYRIMQKLREIAGKDSLSLLLLFL